MYRKKYIKNSEIFLLLNFSLQVKQTQNSFLKNNAEFFVVENNREFFVVENNTEFFVVETEIPVILFRFLTRFLTRITRTSKQANQ